MSVWKSLSAIALGMFLIVGCTDSGSDGGSTGTDPTAGVGTTDMAHGAAGGGAPSHDAEGGSGTGGGAPEEGGEPAPAPTEGDDAAAAPTEGDAAAAPEEGE